MKNSGITIVLSILLSTTSLFSQISEGRVVSKEGLPVDGASVYIRELKRGIAADSRGAFFLNLPKGRYTIDISSMGYTRSSAIIEIPFDKVEIFTLDYAVYKLPEVNFRPGREDRAYIIMRKAIKAAPFHQSKTKSYTAESYLKGSMKLEKIPRLLKMQLKDKRVDMVENKLFVLEQVSEVKYSAPDSYIQTVKAFRNTMPQEIDPGDLSAIVKSSIYAPKFLGNISPLNPRAFAYYRFRYMGLFNENGLIVNKIMVIPKKDGPMLLEGFIYIIDDSWDVHSFDLSSTTMGVTTKVVSQFNNIAQGILMPTSYDIKISVAVLGVRAGGSFYTSLLYSDYITDATKVKDNTIRQSSTSSSGVRVQSNSIEVGVETNSGTPLRRGEGLELKEDTLRNKMTIDTMAKQRDSIYWLKVRTTPLLPEETISFNKRDSFRLEYKRASSEDSVSRLKKRSLFHKMIFGSKIKLSDSSTISYGGAVKIIGDYNFVDGLWLGNTLSYQHTFSKTKLAISPSIYYALSSKRLNWNTIIDYYPKRGAWSLKASFGDLSTDFNSVNGTDRLLNAYYSFVAGKSGINFYRSRYAKIIGSAELATGLWGGAFIGVEERDGLQNTITYNIFNRDVKENIYSQSTSIFNYGVRLTYRHRYFYRMINGVKRYVRSSYPLVNFIYKQGIDPSKGENSSYKMVEANISQNIPLGYYNNISYLLEGGTFFDDRNTHLADYKHFGIASLLVSNADYNTEFALPGNYELSTPDRWLRAGVKYSSSYLLLKHLPFMQSSIMKESVHILSLWLPQQKRSYSELGYSIGVTGVGRAAFYVGFDNVRYRGVGFRVTIPLLKDLSPRMFR